jgi:hypothetical protein
MGLGLSIVNRYIEAMGGTVRVDSKEGVGSVFEIVIPSVKWAAPVTSELESVFQISSDTPDRRRYRRRPRFQSKEDLTVLVIDDDPSIVHTVEQLLTAHGDRVTVAYDGVQGINKLREASFDVVLTDINMSGIDGFALATHLKESGHDSRIVAMTAAAEKIMREEGFADFDAVLTKPFNDDALYRVLRS